jgi:hypothetical protein
MIKVVNHLFGNDLIKNNFYLSQFKNIIFDTDDIDLVKVQIYSRFMENFDIYNVQFKFEKVKDLPTDDEFTMFISKYQIAWDKLYLENIEY